MLNNITIILVNPQGDENIGMVARAMANCGFADLRLVSPVEYKTEGAKKWAVHAYPLIEQAKVFSSVKAACADLASIVGLSRRQGRTRPPLNSFIPAIIDISQRADRGGVALLFGSEADGLVKSDLALCDTIVSIPTDSGYPSLNLAQSVLLVCHQLYLQQLAPDFMLKPCAGRHPFLTKAETGPVLESIKQVLIDLKYNEGDGRLVGKIARHFKEIFGRAGLSRKDANMFFGLMSRIKAHIKEK
ncbi:MAG: TrmH family RNA methyltransferase [Pseudomonadota bacterium]